MSEVQPAGIGDITSDAKGSAARYNGGKPDLSLIPIRIVAMEMANARYPANICDAMYNLGAFQEGGTQFDLFKLLHELDCQWEDCAQVFEYGLRKYSSWNWAKGMPWSAVIASCARHIRAIATGEINDKESGLPHTGHIMCNVVMLVQYSFTYKEGDDRPVKWIGFAK